MSATHEWIGAPDDEGSHCAGCRYGRRDTPFWCPGAPYCANCDQHLDDHYRPAHDPNPKVCPNFRRRSHPRMTLPDVMAARDGIAYLWIDATHRFAKLVRDGCTIARIDTLTDGTVRATADGMRTTFGSWGTAVAWLTARTTAAALEAEALYMLNGREEE